MIVGGGLDKRVDFLLILILECRIYQREEQDRWTSVALLIQYSDFIHNNEEQPPPSPKMHLTLPLLASTMAALTAAFPLTLHPRATALCGDWDNVIVGDYTLYNNLWGKSAATSGSQCTTLDSSTGSTIAWHSSWTWAGGKTSIKSYPNVVVKTRAVPISQIKSIPSTWNWGYSGSGIVADVAYDLFTSDVAGGSERFEMMVWLGNFGAGPISRFVHLPSIWSMDIADCTRSAYSAAGNAVPLATTTIAGQKWNVYKGPNGAMTVFSFLPADGKQIKSFDGDVNLFFKYLIRSQGLPTTQYLKSVGAGTEPTLGSKAVFTTSGYSVKVNYA
jgi:xyloglucan-specific endo-beta-1,4-glucanase